MDSFIDVFKQQLKEHGLKFTTQRRAVFDVMLEHEGEHLSTEEIYEAVKKRYPEVGLATVYRTILLLDRFELIYKIDSDDLCSRYTVMRDKESHRQHHLICMKCGKVADLEENILMKIEEQINQRSNFLVKDHRVKFYGYCEKCIEKA